MSIQQFSPPDIIRKLHSFFSIPAQFSPEQRQRIDADRTDLLYKQSPMGILGTFGCVVLLTYLLRDLIPKVYLITWFSMVMFSVLFRALLVYRYFHRRKTSMHIQQWCWWNVASLGYSGIVWGAASLMIFPVTSLPHQFFLILIISGMIAGASMAFAVMLRAFLIFSVPVILSLVVQMLTIGTEMHRTIGILAIFYWALSYLIAVNIRKTRLQLLILKENLADQVAHRTADLESTNARLKAEIRQRIDAQEERQRLYVKLETARKLEAIATLAGGMAHQFNNTLSVIVGALELMREDADKSVINTKYINLISESADRMSDLTNQLLAYAQGGKYKSRPVDMRQFIENTVSLIQHTFNPAIEVNIEFEPNLPKVEIDDTQIKMAVSAIIANACEAMTAGGRLTIKGRKISIKAEEAERYGNLSPGSYVNITIQDSGVGMSQDTLNRIFEPFFSTKFQGRGLAMAAVYGIIQTHKGHVAVASQRDIGTQVDLFLPSLPPLVPFISGIQNHKELTRGSTSVLLIEDDAAVMAVNKAMLSHIGYGAVCASSGEKAISLIRDPSLVFDLVMLDLNLRDMDGRALIPKIHNHRPQVRIVICSGSALDAATQPLMGDGVHGFIQKPFSLNSLAELLDQVMTATPSSTS